MADDDLETPSMRPVRLSREPSFRLGPLEIIPALRQVVRDGASETIEPRVMQVLVALMRVHGQVVSRNELTASCWDGRIVGENAIDRVISRLRALSAGLGAGAFELETITKVGYRLVVPRQQSSPLQIAYRPVDPRKTEIPVGRRTMIIGSVCVGLVGSAGLYAWNGTRRHQPSAAAVKLYSRGIDAQRQGLSDQTEQAISFLQEAVRLEPDYAEAWGALALSYRHRLQNDPTADQAALAGWVRSAADRALRLDPDNADASVAKVILDKPYGKWTTLDPQYRAALARYPQHWLLRGTFGLLMYQVGRSSEGIEKFRANVAQDPFLPMSRVFLGAGLWNLGRLHEAEATIESALSRWPTHPAIWFQRFWFMTYSGRPEIAIAMAANGKQRPYGPPDAYFEDMIATARAVESGAPRDVDAAVAIHRAKVDRTLGSTPNAVQALSSLGRIEQAFALLANYYQGRKIGNAMPKLTGPHVSRETDFLFAPPTRALRSDPRFAELTTAIGLDEYWKSTGSIPDYRRA